MNPWVLLAICFFLFATTAFCQSAATHPSAGNIPQSDSTFSQVRRLFQKGKYDSAAIMIERGLALSEKNGPDSFPLKFYLEKANLVMVRGDKKAGLQILHLKAAPYVNRHTSYRIVDKYYNLMGTCYRTLLNYDSALYYFRENEKLNNIHDPYSNWLAYYQLALTYMQANLPLEAEQYFWKSYKLT